mmetsp:Transcript_14627/g.40490  ORF Transcript_14627/g.40490 Transcript_14627/m.40490 type:complete len:294 (-) Transcript_14627:38-919(-)|eukprot:CAMPEP_0168771766 /NCGR_PEP_ID=MMETSP0725-20121227/3608_1 /TAXON_ID=265536 /ORGANISM="Amphiprora sp., Strain CCMP467" /LENGTH=293 /DNA_ID=CAMNT_0008821259 /DNA_START=230 /DNA_END=1111 /DNA_ORIENTATION=-
MGEYPTSFDDPTTIIDIERYPIDQPSSPAYAELIKTIRKSLDHDGCAVLPSFFSQSALAALIKDANEQAPNVFVTEKVNNPYFTEDDATLDPSHPARRFAKRSLGFITAENFKDNSPLRIVYFWQAFFDFIRDALDEPKDKFFRYADPLSNVIINMTTEGNGFPWHFDTNNYTVTSLLQPADEGGIFEYVPFIRKTEGGEENFEAVRQIMDGEFHQRPTQLDLKPGDLQIFHGRYSLHRVSPTRGPTPRFVATFSYTEDPNMVCSLRRVKELYGKVLPVHIEHGKTRQDKFLD